MAACPADDHREDPATCTGVERNVVMGDPDRWADDR
jgi:hypothetical protein